MLNETQLTAYLSRFDYFTLAGLVREKFVEVIERKSREEDKRIRQEIVVVRRKKEELTRSLDAQLNTLKNEWEWLIQAKNTYYIDAVRFPKDDLVLLENVVNSSQHIRTKFVGKKSKEVQCGVIYPVGFVHGTQQTLKNIKTGLIIHYELDTTIENECYFRDFKPILEQITENVGVRFLKEKLQVFGEGKNTVSIPYDAIPVRENLFDDQSLDDVDWTPLFKLSRDWMKTILKWSRNLEKNQKQYVVKECAWRLTTEKVMVVIGEKKIELGVKWDRAINLITENLYRFLVLDDYRFSYSGTHLKCESVNYPITYLFPVKIFGVR